MSKALMNRVSHKTDLIFYFIDIAITQQGYKKVTGEYLFIFCMQDRAERLIKTAGKKNLIDCRAKIK